MSVFRAVLAGLLVTGIGAWAQSGNKPVKGIDIVVKKQPTGSGALVKTDASGAVRFRLPEAGTYAIEIQNPLGTASLPEGVKAMSVKLQGQTSKAIKTEGLPNKNAVGPLLAAEETPRLASGRLVQDASATRNRLEHPGITFDESGRSHIETITVSEATDLMLRLTDDTPLPGDATLRGLPAYLSFVAIEGGPSPRPYPMEAVSPGNEVTPEWNPATPADNVRIRLTNVPSRAGLQQMLVAPLTDGLRAGFYGGNIDFLIGGNKIEETVPVYIRILPRGSTLPPTASRKVLFFPSNSTLQTITVYNQNPVAQTYSMRNESEGDNRAVLFSPQEFPLGPGESRTVTVQFLQSAAGEKTITIVNRNGDRFTFHLVKLAAQLQRCVATKLYPVIGTVGFAASGELGANASIEVYDNCGVKRDDATVKGTDENTAQSKAVKVEGLPNKPATPKGKGHKIEAWAPGANGGEIVGESQVYAMDQLELPALADDDKPVVLEELVNATSGEPTVLAPGMTALYWVKAPVRCCRISFGDKEATNIQRTDDGLLFDIPADIEPQGKTKEVTKGISNIKLQARGIFIAPSSPAIETTAEGTAVLLKHADLEDPGDDYTTNGNAAPKAGDTVSVYVTGLGLATIDNIRILVNGTPGNLLGIIKCPGPNPYCRPRPRATENGAGLFFTMPEVPSDAESEGPATIQVMAIDVTSNIGTTTNVLGGGPGKLNGFLVSTIPAGRTVRINGTDFTYTPPAPFDPINLFGPTTDATFDVVPDKQLDSNNALVRYDFASWNFGGPRQQTRTMPSLSLATANFLTMVKVTVTGATVGSKAADDFYEAGTSLTLTPTCPAGQVLDLFEVEERSLLTGTPFNTFTTTSLTTKFNLPAIVTTKCRAAAAGTILVTVNTNVPQALIAPAFFTVGIAQSGGSASNNTSLQVPVTPGAATVTVTPKSQLNAAGDVRFDFKNWSGNGVTAPGTLDVGQPVTVPNAATTYTANFDFLNKLTVKVNGTCSVTPNNDGFYLNGSQQTLTVTPAAAFQSATYEAGSGAATVNLQNGGTFQFVGGTLTVNCSSGPSACVAAPAGPGGWWSFETATGPVLDRMPLALHGIRRGNPVSIPGKVGNALRFDGASSVEVPYNAIFDTPISAGAQSNFTMDAWVRIDPTLAVAGGRLAGVRQSPGVTQVWSWGVGKNAQGLYAENVVASSGYENFSSSGLAINDNNWHFVAIRLVRDPATGFANITFWLDGVKQPVNTGTKVNDLSASGRSFFIGFSGYTGAPGEHFTGDVDEFEYFQRALTDAEVESIYNAGDKGKCPPTPSTGVTITVNSNPAAVGAVAGAAFGATGLGSSAPTFTTTLPAGTTSLAVTAASPVTNAAAGIRYELQTTNTWSVNGTANPIYTGSPQPVAVPTANTTYTANYRTLYEVKVVINGTCTVTPTQGFYPANSLLPVTITPAAGATASWGFSGVSLTVPSGGSFPVLAPGTLTVNCGSGTPQPVLVNTNPPGIGALVKIGNLPSGPNAVSGSFPSGSSQAIEAQQQVVFNGIVYTFDNWSPAGIPVTTPPTGATVTIPASGSATYTANYRTSGFVVTISGCGATAGPLSQAIQTSPLAFPPNASVLLTANPPSGQTFTNFSITMGGTTTTRTTNPTNLTLTGPANIVATCGAPNTVPLTVVTNPANLAVVLTVAGLTPGSGSGSNGQYQANAVAGADGMVSASPVQVFNAANTIRWDFNNWTGAGISTPVTVANQQPFKVQPTATNLVANYNTFFKIDVVNNGCGTISPAAGFYASGTPVTINVAAGGSNQVSSITFGLPGGAGTALSPIQNNSTMVVDSPKVLTATCGAAPTGGVTVNTNPANLGVVVGVTGAGSAANSFTAPTLPAGPVAITVNTLGPIVTTQGVEYGMDAWRQGAGPNLGSGLSQAGTVTAGVTTTYTAHYRITGNRVTIVNNGCTTVGTTPAVPANGIWPVNTNMTGLSATPPAGGTLTNVVAAVLDPTTGQTTNLTFNSLPIANPLPINTPWVITFNCAGATNVAVTVNTNPAGIGATVGVGSASGVNTVSANLPAGSTQLLSASANALVTTTGIGYLFSGWSPAGPSVTLPGSGSVTYTANYSVACSLIRTSMDPSGTGTITLSPPSPGNLPPNCYPNGTSVTATIVPASGRIAGQILPGAAGPGGASPYTFTVTGPALLIGTTAVALAPAPNVTWTFVSRNGMTAVFRATNSGTVPATNLRITALTPSPGVRYRNQPPLPVAVSTIAPGASATVTLPFELIAESLEPNTNAAFSVALTSQADNLASSVVNIQVPAPPETTVRLEAVSRTNASNTGTLVFRVVNTGANPTLTLSLGLQVTGAAGLTFPNNNFQLVAPLAPGASQQVTFQIALPAGQNMAAATLTATLQAGGNIPLTTARWRFDPPTAIVPLP